MAKRFTVSAVLEAQDRASREIDQVQGSLGRLGGLLRTGLVAAAAAGAAALTGFVAVMRRAVGASNVQADALNRLTAALAPLGDAAAGVTQRLEAQAAALQKVTTFGDEAILKGQALFASFSRNEDEIRAATKAALDLSAALGQDLQTSFQLLGRAAAGNTSALSRYGIVVDESIPQSERFAAALEKINEQFGGQAEAQARTFQGRVTQMKNAFGDLLEVLGDAITQNEALAGAIDQVTEAMSSARAQKAVRSFSDAIAELVAEVVRATGDLADFARGLGAVSRETTLLGTSVRVLGDTFGILWRAALDATRPFQLLIEGFARLGRESGRSAAALAQAEETQRRMAEAAEEAAGKFQDASAHVAAYREHVLALARAQSDSIAESDAFIAAMDRLGVTIESQVNAKLAENNKLLVEAEGHLRRGEITAGDFARIQAALADENERLRLSLEGVGSAAERSAAGLSAAAEGTGQLGRADEDEADGIRTARDEVELFGASAEVTRAGVARLGGQVVQTAAQFDQLARSAGQAAAVAAAVAGGGQVVLGGTRVLLPGGGSRLTSEPGGPKSRVRPDGSREFF
jgi:hypothetical protein